MKTAGWFGSRFEILNAVLIAIVSLSTAFAVWRTNVIGSNAANQSRRGMIDAVKKQALTNENYRKVYEEAGFAYQFAVKQAEAQALEASDDPASQDRAANIQQYLLPNMQLIASPLATDEEYQNPDGTYDLGARLEDMPTEEERQLDPAVAFDRAESLYAQQRWLAAGSVLLAVSLFWLAMAEISSERRRLWGFVFGLAVYLLGLTWFFGVEIGFFLIRGGGG